MKRLEQKLRGIFWNSLEIFLERNLNIFFSVQSNGINWLIPRFERGKMMALARLPEQPVKKDFCSSVVLQNWARSVETPFRGLEASKRSKRARSRWGSTNQLETKLIWYSEPSIYNIKCQIDWKCERTTGQWWFTVQLYAIWFLRFIAWSGYDFSWVSLIFRLTNSIESF